MFHKKINIIKQNNLGFSIQIMIISESIHNKIIFSSIDLKYQLFDFDFDYLF